MKKGTSTPNPSQLIDEQIRGITDWRGPMLTKLRKLINDASPGIAEEWKWGTAVWVQNGLVCSTGAFKDHVKINFFKGASLADPKKLFNAGLDAKTTRSIDFHQGDKLDEAGIKELVRTAVAANKKK